MLILAISIHILAHYSPSWILKIRLKELRNQLSWKRALLEMNGLIVDFFLAFIIISIIIVFSHDKYLLNKNAIYGVNCSPISKELGFRDGDKILSVNNQEVEKFSDIITKIVLEYGKTDVKVLRGEKEVILDISNADKLKIMRDKSQYFFTPRLKPDSIVNLKPENLVYTESRNGLKESFVACRSAVSSSYFQIFKPAEIKSIGGFVIFKVTNIRTMFTLLAVTLINVGLVSLIPLPGFDTGNAIIAIIEKVRNRTFNTQKMGIIRKISITITLIFILLRIYLA